MALRAPSPISLLDSRCVWHPYTQAQTTPTPIPIVRGEGVYLYSEDGKRYIDAVSSWWVNLHGHAHPYIVDQIHRQAQQLEQVIFAGFTHAPAVELAKRLLSLLPGHMHRIFYADNGSTAVEAALKIALQYWQNLDAHTEKTRVICFKGGYHGDTFGAMSASGKQPLHRPFWNYLFQVDAIDPPLRGDEARCLRQFAEIASQGKSACFIFEPLLLGASGMIIYPAKPLEQLLQLCRQHQILAIADEILTGFGRTGTLFACEQVQTPPDLYCLSKGLTGGFLPLGAIACTEKIYRAFLDQRLDRAFLHGHSFSANPLACRSALASLDLLEQPESQAQRNRIAAQHQQFCAAWSGHPRLVRCESLGTLLVLEYKTDKITSYFQQEIRNRLYRFFIDAGILVRPLGNVLYLLPPYCISLHDLEYIYAKISETLFSKYTAPDLAANHC